VFAFCLANPFNILWFFGHCLGSYGDFEAMGVDVVHGHMSTGLRFHQEWKSASCSSKFFRKLYLTKCVWFDIRAQITKVCTKSLMTNWARNRWNWIPLWRHVPGDWVKLSAGDLIPADIQIVNQKTFCFTIFFDWWSNSCRKYVPNLHQSSENRTKIFISRVNSQF